MHGWMDGRMCQWWMRMDRWMDGVKVGWMDR